MRVIRKGRTQNGAAHERTCTGKGNGGGGCSAVLLVEQRALYADYTSDYLGDRDYYTKFRCSQCGVATTIANYIMSGVSHHYY